MPARVVIEHVIGYTHKPRLERGLPPEGGYTGIYLDEGVLCQVITQLTVSQRLVQKEPSYR